MQLRSCSLSAPSVELVDPVQAAKAARLSYVHDRQPGIGRRRSGRGFTYIDANGATLRDGVVLRRLRALAIPPAWTDVWICPSPNGHLQATGRDARGRKQYRYHDRWRSVRDEAKYHHVIAFGEHLPALRERVGEDLGRRHLSREKLLATVVSLLDATLIRVGNEAYARANHSFGLTTLHNSHVEISGPTLHFRFRGKGGKDHAVDLRDRRLANAVRHCQELPGQELFVYQDEDGRPRSIDSEDVNQYMQAITDENFTAKDFRTWGGTAQALEALCELGPAETETEARQNVAEAIRRTALRLGNTPAICRRCYVHPAVIESYLQGSLFDELAAADAGLGRGAGESMSPTEARLLALLKRLATHGATG